MAIKQVLVGKTLGGAVGDMGYLIGFGITGQPLLRKSQNAPKIWVKYQKAGVKRRRRFGSAACAMVFARETKGATLVVINDGKTKQLTKYVNGFFIKTKTINLKSTQCLETKK